MGLPPFGDLTVTKAERNMGNSVLVLKLCTGSLTKSQVALQGGFFKNQNHGGLFVESKRRID